MTLKELDARIVSHQGVDEQCNFQEINPKKSGASLFAEVFPVSVPSTTTTGVSQLHLVDFLRYKCQSSPLRFLSFLQMIWIRYSQNRRLAKV